ncbi:hypothetical protein [Pedobacter sp. UC225_65]|uniref:hypothetical protein n=1 Tax=Pedobacter sp. UC225_65 TaxID=3350173 RepID=UPI00366A9E7E
MGSIRTEAFADALAIKAEQLILFAVGCGDLDSEAVEVELGEMAKEAMKTYDRVQ